MVGVLAFGGVWLFISNTVVIDATHEYEVTYHVFQVVRHPARYEVDFCGIELTRDDNPDGRDIDHTISLLNWMDVWGTRLVSLVCGLLVGCAVNFFLRLTFQSRRSESG